MAQPHSIAEPDLPEDALQPPCPTCAAPTRLVRMSKFDDDRDLRTFKCGVCEHTQITVIKTR